jgi:DNA-directed RNA polymerase subunit alpha
LGGKGYIEAVNKLRSELHDKELMEILDNMKSEFEKNKLSPNSLEKNMKLCIEDCNFSVRTYNCLKRGGYDTIADIIKDPKSKLQTIRNLGGKGYIEVESFIKSLGLEIGGY